jgi:hypothetical protein
MSHVLDRMIRRARTAAPAVEPLYQARYQPHARAYSGMPASREAAESFLDESPESAEFARTAPKRHGTAPTPAETISRAAEARSQAGTATNPATLIGPTPPAQLFDTGGQTLSAVEREEKRARPGRPGSFLTSGLREENEDRTIGALDSTDARKREGARARSTDASIEFAPREELRAISAPESTRLSPRGASETPAQNSAEVPLDVTISIGHIEVRSPQVIERPRRPAFRPKTSLADFLKPRQGGARE